MESIGSVLGYCHWFLSGVLYVIVLDVLYVVIEGVIGNCHWLIFSLLDNVIESFEKMKFKFRSN